MQKLSRQVPRPVRVLAVKVSALLALVVPALGLGPALGLEQRQQRLAVAILSLR